MPQLAQWLLMTTCPSLSQREAIVLDPDQYERVSPMRRFVPWPPKAIFHFLWQSEVSVLAAIPYDHASMMQLLGQWLPKEACRALLRCDATVPPRSSCQ